MYGLGDRHHLPNIDWSRHGGLLDHELLARSRIACIGVGGAAGLVQNLTRCGIKTWTLVDFDHVTMTSPATQAYHSTDNARSKVIALAGRVGRINLNARVTPLVKRYAELAPDENAALWQADLVLAMTDDFATQSAINRDAVRTGTDTIFAICYIGCEAVEITASFADTVAAGGGCHRCHTKARYDAYQTGFANPPVIASHALAAEYLNALIGLIVVSRLHQRAGSPLAIAEIARDFAARPCLISRMIPSFGAGPGEAFAGLAPVPFTPSLWPLDTPRGWTCPDCGTPGIVAPAAPQCVSAHAANPGLGPTERS